MSGSVCFIKLTLKVLIPEKPDRTMINAADTIKTPNEAILTIILMALLPLLEKR